MIKVLVVEDDPMVGKLHEHYLTQIKGFQLCDIVRNSDEALKIMQTKEYNLVILDIFASRATTSEGKIQVSLLSSSTD